MCGITGLIATRPIHPPTLQQMTDMLVHRGPDGDGIWLSSDHCVGLGHRRLAIIGDTDQAAQPMTDASGRYSLTFNGEIYNYKEIAQDLRRENVECDDGSDTAVLFAALIHWGTDALARLNGMFALAFVDTLERQVLCARDRFGEKPFLFAQGNGFFAFASEYKSLLTLKEVSGDISYERLVFFLADGRSGLDTDRKTVFPVIQQLCGGEYLQLDLDTLVSRRGRYWTLNQRPLEGGNDLKESAAAFYELMKDAVALRLRSDVPVGSCLSGGLDSSFIVALARSVLGSDAEYKAFHGSFPGSVVDERTFAETLAKSQRAQLNVTEPSPADFLNHLDDYMWLNELPMNSLSQYAQWCVFKLAKEVGVTVLLDGQGADEILGGYEQYFQHYLASLRAAGENTVANEEEQKIRARYPLALPTPSMRLKSIMPLKLKRGLSKALGRGSDMQFALSPEVREPFGARGEKSWTEQSRSPLHDALLHDSLEASLPSLLRYGDRNSMAHSREVRLPFCDHRVVEFAMSQPVSSLMGGAETKSLLRRAMRGAVPKEISDRWGKQGFRPPQAEWLRNPAFRDALGDALGGQRSQNRGLWRMDWLRQAHRRLDEGDMSVTDTLWKFFITEAWFERFIARSSTGQRFPVFD